MRLVLCGTGFVWELRSRVLERAGFQVDAVDGLEGLLRLKTSCAPNVFVLCSTLSGTDRLSSAAWLDENFPGVPVVRVLRELTSEWEAGNCVTAWDGPAALVEICKPQAARSAQDPEQS